MIVRECSVTLLYWIERKENCDLIKHTGEEFWPSNEWKDLENNFGSQYCIGANQAGQKGYVGTQPGVLNVPYTYIMIRLIVGNQLALRWCRNDRGGGNQVREERYHANNEMRRWPLPRIQTLSRHGSFDVIVGMDWLSYNKAMIVCHEKVVEIPLVDGEILRVHGERVEESTK
ncbi:hypothetical protein Tco_1126832, partial [Tanacetum coccineum]